MKFNKKPDPRLLAAALVCTLATGHAALAQGQRSLAAHVHGTTQVQIALEDGLVSIALQAPGADIVGFEHPVETPEDAAAISHALETLSLPLGLFAPDRKAGCETHAVRVSQVGGQPHGGSETGHDDDDHDHDGDRDDDHSGGDHQGHGHGDEDEGEERHLEFRAEYVLACTDLSALDGLDLAFFQHFDRARHIHFQVLTSQGALTIEVERSEPRLTLKTGG